MKHVTIASLLSYAAAQGFHVDKARGVEASGQKELIRVYPKDQDQRVIQVYTDEDPQNVRTVLGQLKRAGLPWPPPPAVKEGNGITGQVVDVTDAPPPFRMVSPATKSVVPTPTPADSADRLFVALKEARLYADLTSQEVKGARAGLEEIHRKCDVAEAEHRQALEALDLAKQEFDRAFTVGITKEGGK